ncbi:hypothetical protein CK203_053705 [Vitis vinifera]|uniref:DUF659 domain-containing protein n=1 Tax=Vitis vinifera TaxID=29760 RepID=A0A438GS68_VITVI|nr:hypothetical protein CK203_053705 [Vitis vinifera]
MGAMKVFVNVGDHGRAVDEKEKTHVLELQSCLMSGFTRLKYHLEGIRGDVSPCGEVPTNVKELMREKILELKRGNLRKEIEKLNQHNLSLKRKSFLKPKNVKQEKLEPFRILVQVECEFPSYQELKVWILQYMVKEMLHNVHGIRDTWAIMWSNIIVDGWKDEKGRNLMNFFVDCPRLLRMSGCKMWCKLFPILHQKVMEAVGHSLVEKCQTVFWRVSASHCIEMIFEKIGMMGNIREILDKAKTVTRFIHSYAAALNHMRNHTCVHDLVKASKSKLAILILTLLNISLRKVGLEKMLISAEWETSCWASRREAERVADIMVDPYFLSGAEMVLKATVPLVGVQCSIIGGDKDSAHFIQKSANAFLACFEGVQFLIRRFFEGINCCVEHMVPDDTSKMREHWRRLEYWDKARKKDLTVKRPEGDMDQDLLSGTEGDMCRRSRDRIRLSKSSISESVRFRRKLKFQEKGREYQN